MSAVHVWNWKKFPLQLNKFIGICVFYEELSEAVLKREINIWKNSGSIGNQPTMESLTKLKNRTDQLGEKNLVKLMGMYPSNVYTFNPYDKLLPGFNHIFVKNLRTIYDNEKNPENTGKRTVLLDFRKIKIDSDDLAILYHLLELPNLHFLAVGDLISIPKICLTVSNNIFFSGVNVFNAYSHKMQLQQVETAEDFILVTDYSSKDLTIYGIKESSI